MSQTQRRFPRLAYSSCLQWSQASGNVGTFSLLTPSEAQAACCSNSRCVGFSFEPDRSNSSIGGGFYKGNANCSLVNAPGLQGFTQTRAIPPLPATLVASPASPMTMTVNLSVSWSGLPAPNASTDWVALYCNGFPIEGEAGRVVRSTGARMQSSPSCDQTTTSTWASTRRRTGRLGAGSCPSTTSGRRARRSSSGSTVASRRCTRQGS